jgi:hypothetical protein
LAHPFCKNHFNLINPVKIPLQSLRYPVTLPRP